MSHNISTTSGKAEVFTAIKPAWHHLGVTVPDCVTWKDAVKYANLDWQIEKRQLIDPVSKEPINQWGLFRSDTNTFINTCGENYQLIQQSDLFQLMDEIIDRKDGAHYESAGALGVGEQVWGLIRLPEDIKIKGSDDKFRTYLLGLDRRDGRAGIIKYVNTRVVCQNTVDMAMRETNSSLRLTHYGYTDRKQEAEAIIKGLDRSRTQWDILLNELASVKLSISSIKEIIQTIWPKITENWNHQRQAFDVLRLFESNDDDAHKSERGTALNLYNAITQWTDHSRTANDKIRAKSALFGAGNSLKFYALTVIARHANIKSEIIGG